MCGMVAQFYVSSAVEVVGEYISACNQVSVVTYNFRVGTSAKTSVPKGSLT